MAKACGNWRWRGRAGARAAAVVLACALSACENGGGGDGAASSKRVSEILAEVREQAAALKKAACKQPAAEAKLGELAQELVSKHGAAPGTPRALREIVDCGCPSVQRTTVDAVRQLRPFVEGKSAPFDLAELLAAGLSSGDPTLRHVSAMSVYEVRLDPRGTRVDDLLRTMAEKDLDDKARQTAAWVREQLAKKYPG